MDANHLYTEYVVPIKYKRSALSYGGAFKYWDRFTKLKKMSKIRKGTDIKVVANYNPNPDIVIMWTDSGAFLLDKKDFIKAMNDILDSWSD